MTLWTRSDNITEIRNSYWDRFVIRVKVQKEARFDSGPIAFLNILKVGHHFEMQMAL
jgi:hypothetical protein